MKAMEIVTIVSSLIGALLLMVALFASNGAPQQAAGAALGVGFAVIPYCITATMQRARLLTKQGPQS